MSHSHASSIPIVLLLLSAISIASAFGQQGSKPADRHDPASPTKPPDKPPSSVAERGDAQQPAPARPSQKPDGIKLDAKLVSVTVTVSDRYGRFVSGLTKDDFEIFDDNVKQDIEIFGDEDAPVSMGIVYDVSGSMSDLTSQSFAALRKFFDTSHEDDEFFVIAFNRKPQLVQDFTTSPADILGKVIFIKAKGMTALYDATYLAIEKARQGRHPKKALLIISDGEENSSRYSHGELQTLLKEAGVQIYAIGGGVLGHMAELTGGRAFEAWGADQTWDTFKQIAIYLRHQYVIGFYPTNTASRATWHKVRLRIKGPRSLGKLTLSYKKDYESFR
jgi:Ca-activated chloride channel family protein